MKVYFELLYIAFFKNIVTCLACGTKLLMAAVVCIITSFVFWCLGNAWILNKYSHVEYHNITSSNYCYAPLFKGTFGIVITTDIWYGVFVLMNIFICFNKEE